MKTLKRHIPTILSAIGIALIMYFLRQFYLDFLIAANRLEFPAFDIYRAILSVGMILIGWLVELRRIIAGFIKGFRINILLLVISLLLAAVLFIPYEVMSRITGMGFWFDIMQLGIFRSAWGILAGIGMIRAITKPVA